MNSAIEKLKRKYPTLRTIDRAEPDRTLDGSCAAEKGILGRPEESKGGTESYTLADADSVTIAVKAAAEDLPEDIRELKALMAELGVVIYTNRCEPYPVYVGEEFRGREEQKARLRHLLKNSDAVLDFLYLHHAERIHLDNFNAGLFRGRFGAKGMKV